MNQKTTDITQCIEQNLRQYFKDLDGTEPCGVYDMVLHQVEKPMLACVMEQCGGNQSKAAVILGLNRNTLRKNYNSTVCCNAAWQLVLTVEGEITMQNPNKLNIHFILHEAFEVPGAYLKWAQWRGHNISATKVYEREALPDNVDDIDFLIVMGGPQSPDEDRQAFPYYDPQSELRLMRQAMAADKYIVGVCLGAQLLSVAYGARHTRSPEREIGIYPIELTAEGLADAHVSLLGKTLNTGHWHGDMPGLTDEAVVLATSKGCPRQIIRFAPKHYAFQAHLEFDREAVGLLIAADGRDKVAEQSQAQTYIQHPDKIEAADFSEMNAKLFDFLDSLTQTK